MMRNGWLAGGLCLSIGLLGACSGSDDDEQSNELDGEDAGVQNFEDDLKELRDRVNGLNPQLDMFGKRLDALEAPKTPGSCSAGELCIPDGINLAKAGFQPIIKALCTRATTCCEARELNWLYGAALKTEGDCEAAFTDLINNGKGYIQDYYNYETEQYDLLFGGHLEDIVRAAHALNDTNVLVEIDPAAVTACADQLKAKGCYNDAYEGPDGCSPYPSGEKDLCSLSLLLKGKEREGDTCQPGYFNECGAGLVCRPTNGGYNGGDGDGDGDGANGQSGICATKAAVGDRCLQQSDCDDLYCDQATATCKTRAKEGEPCALVDPTFEDVDFLPDEGGLGLDRFPEGSITTIDCEPGFACNGAVCAKAYCGQGSLCRGNSQCPSGFACLNTSSPALQAYSDNHSFAGVCTAGLPDGSVCTFYDTWYSNENACASGICKDPQGDNTFNCQPKPVACDYGCRGTDCRTCAAGSYCSYNGVCETQIANGQNCNEEGHMTCASGFCNAGTCEARVASGGSCPSGYNEQCPPSEYCNNGTCADGADLNEACDPKVCAQGLLCWEGATSICYKYDDYADRFYDLPNGTLYCSNDDQCASGFCRYGYDDPNACSALIPEGGACDSEFDYYAHHCIAGFACRPDEASGTGYSCQKYKLPGEVCDPTRDECGFNGNGGCSLRNDQFLCDYNTGDEPFCVPLDVER